MGKRRNLSRGRKAARNLLVFAFLLVAIWAGYQSPWWMMEYEMRQDARREFEVLWKGGQDGFIAGGERVDSTLAGGAHTLVALVDDSLCFGVLTGYEGHPHIRTSWRYPLEESGPSVFFLRLMDDYIYIMSYSGGEWFLATGLPGNAVSGELTVTMGGKSYTSCGNREMEVIWFPMTVDPEHDTLYDYEAMYDLKLYDARGMLVSCTSGPVYKEAVTG